MARYVEQTILARALEGEEAEGLVLVAGLLASERRSLREALATVERWLDQAEAHDADL